MLYLFKQLKKAEVGRKMGTVCIDFFKDRKVSSRRVGRTEDGERLPPRVKPRPDAMDYCSRRYRIAMIDGGPMSQSGEKWP